MAKPLRTVPALLVILGLGAAAPATAGEGGFVWGIGDLPLMGGLAQDARLGLLFDKPEGRIVESVARGALQPGAVRAFYASTLPQLGWRIAGPDRWARDGEALALEFAGPSATAAPDCCLTVRFRLNPSSH